MTQISRRGFVKLAGGAAAAVGVSGMLSPRLARASKGRVVVVGGGYGGSVAAKYIKMADPGIEVTLIEQHKEYYSCPLSNWVVADFRDMALQKWGYETLAKKYGINVVHDHVNGIDPAKKEVTTEGGKSFAYDRLVVSPGVSFNFGAYEGLTEEICNTKILHAWNAGPQTTALRDQLKAMEDGANFVIVAPPDPYRCPPGPYERASLVAWYLKKNKPKSKVIILDTKEKFSKKDLFEQGWTQLYGYGTDQAIISWVSSAEGKVTGIDVAGMVVKTEMDEIKAGVINVIPPQKAGKIAQLAGLANEKGWCPVDFTTFESKLHKDVHVIGDSSAAPKMPKSGYAANSQAKVAAAAIVALLNGKPVGTPSYVNTCYSMLSPEYGISVANVYQYTGGEEITPVGLVDKEGKPVLDKESKPKASGGVSPKDAPDAVRKQEALFNESWYQSIMADTFL